MKANKQGRQLMLRLQDIRERKAELEIAEKAVEFELRELLRSLPDHKFEYDDLIATYVQSNRITYNVDELKATFPKEVFKQLVDEEFVVDKGAMRDLLEEHPDLRQQIGSALKRVVAANPKKIEAAHANGIVELEELKKCCTIQTSEYTRMVKKAKG